MDRQISNPRQYESMMTTRTIRECTMSYIVTYTKRIVHVSSCQQRWLVGVDLQKNKMAHSSQVLLLVDILSLLTTIMIQSTQLTRNPNIDSRIRLTSWFNGKKKGPLLLDDKQMRQIFCKSVMGGSSCC